MVQRQGLVVGSAVVCVLMAVGSRQEVVVQEGAEAAARVLPGVVAPGVSYLPQLVRICPRQQADGKQVQAKQKKQNAGHLEQR